MTVIRRYDENNQTESNFPAVVRLCLQMQLKSQSNPGNFYPRACLKNHKLCFRFHTNLFGETKN